MRAACAIVLMLCGCGSRGAVTFTVREPVYGPLNPISDLVTEYSIMPVINKPEINPNTHTFFFICNCFNGVMELTR